MSRFEHKGVVWPPTGWSQLATIQSSSGQSLAKDIRKARIYGLQYRIESMPLFKDNKKFFRHDIEIDGWEYSILNESVEYPVLSFSVMDRFDSSMPRECFVCDIRSYDTHIPHTRMSATRAVSAALFLIRQIATGSVPDINRVLRTYKLHPNQAVLYRGDHLLKSGLEWACHFNAAVGNSAKP